MILCVSVPLRENGLAKVQRRKEHKGKRVVKKQSRIDLLSEKVLL